MLVKKCKYKSGYRLVRVKTNWRTGTLGTFCSDVVNCRYSDSTGFCQLNNRSLLEACKIVGGDYPIDPHTFIPDQQLYECYLKEKK